MRFRALDGLRGIAAVCVTLFHIRAISPALLGHLPHGFVLGSYLFVDCFFVLSGFVIACTYADRLRGGTDLLRFGLRRFFRLWPLHAATLAALILIELVRLPFFHGVPRADGIGVPFGTREQADSILANLVLVQSLGFFGSTTWNVPSWSISVEFYTYAVFALSCLIGGRRRPWLWAALALLGGVVLIDRSDRFMDATYDNGLFRCLFGFFSGTLTWLAFRRMRERTAWLAGWVAAAIEVALAATALGFIAVADASPLSFASPLVFAAVIYVFAFGRGPVSALLLGRLPQWLGQVSYSIYLLQWLVLLCFTLGLHMLQILRILPGDVTMLERVSPLAGDAFVVGYVVVICGLAALTWRFIEEPPQRWIAARLRQAAVGVGTPAAEPALR